MIGDGPKNLGSLIAKTLGQGARRRRCAGIIVHTPFFYPAETPDAIAYHDPPRPAGQAHGHKDVAPLVRFLVTEGAWIIGQLIVANDVYTTRTLPPAASLRPTAAGLRAVCCGW